MRLMREHDGHLQVQRLRLVRRGGPNFTLFPMVHIADRGFFEQVGSNADAHDLVLKEGSRTAAGRTANRAHVVASLAHPTLAAQSNSMRESSGAHWVNSDLAHDTFNTRWQQIPLYRRVLFHILMPLLGLALRLPKVRRVLIEEMGKDVPDAREDIDDLFGKGFHDLVVKQRDQALIDACEHTLNIWDSGDVAVVWGAAHIPPLAMALVGQHGYRITERNWMTVLSAPGTSRQAALNSSNA